MNSLLWVLNHGPQSYHYEDIYHLVSTTLTTVHSEPGYPPPNCYQQVGLPTSKEKSCIDSTLSRKSANCILI